MTISAIIIDDEPLAHEVLTHHIANLNGTSKQTKVDVKFQGYNAMDAIKWLSEHSVDLIFLDIKMPNLSGIELVKVLANRPQVIFVTAYQEHAVEAFELDVTDYLVKPVSAPRLMQALDKVQKRLPINTRNQEQTHLQAEETPRTISLNISGAKRIVSLSDIHWFEAYGNYVKVWLGEEMLLVNSSFKQLLEQLPLIDTNQADKVSLNVAQPRFAKVHKSYGVNLLFVEQVNTETLTLKSGVEVKIGKTFKKAIKAML